MMPTSDNLSDALARKVEPPVDGKPYRIIYDGAVKGFGLRVTKAGARSFVLNYRIKGIERRYTIGSWPDWKTVAAREEASRLKREIDKGRDPMGARHDERATPTLREFAERYMAEYGKPHKKPRTVEEDRRNLELHLLPSLGNRKITDVEEADVARFVAGRRDYPISANRCLALLSHMMTMAEEWKMRPRNSNPCRGAKRFAETHRDRYLNGDELARLGDALTAAEGKEPAAALAAIRLLLLSGGRLNEILTLEWSMVDFGAGCLRLVDSKTGPKTIPLGAPALQILADLPRREKGVHVLPAARGSGHFIGIQKVWQRVRTAAGLPDVRLHDLRHSFASMSVASGDSLFLLGKVLGHRQSSTTERYSHISHGDPLRALADRNAGKIADLLAGGRGGEADAVDLPRIGRR
jgi:integrase